MVDQTLLNELKAILSPVDTSKDVDAGELRGWAERYAGRRSNNDLELYWLRGIGMTSSGPEFNKKDKFVLCRAWESFKRADRRHAKARMRGRDVPRAEDERRQGQRAAYCAPRPSLGERCLSRSH